MDVNRRVGLKLRSTNIANILRRSASWVVLRLALLAVVIYVVGPFLWLLISSLETRVQMFSRPPTWIPNPLNVDNYVRVLSDPTFMQSMANSAMVASLTTLITLVFASLAAYAFARMQFPGRNSFFLSILATQMLPSIALLIPLYATFRSLGLLHSFRGLIIAYLTFNLPYAIWLLRAFFISIPSAIEEAARVDGCSRVGAILRVILPLSAPGLVSAGVFVFLGAWNEFMMATVITDLNTRTFPVRMGLFIGEETIAYEDMFSAAVLGTIPIILLVIIFQRFIIRGLTEGATNE